MLFSVMVRTSLSHTFHCRVYLLVESLQVNMKPSFSLTFFLTERMQNLVYLIKSRSMGQTCCINSLQSKEFKSV